MKGDDINNKIPTNNLQKCTPDNRNMLQIRLTGLAKQILQRINLVQLMNYFAIHGLTQTVSMVSLATLPIFQIPS